MEETSGKLAKSVESTEKSEFELDKKEHRSPNSVFFALFETHQRIKKYIDEYKIIEQ